MRRLRAGLVGLGMMGRHHARVLGDLPGVELVGAIDPDPRARTAARSVSAAADLDELLSLGIDICVVAVPTLMHAAIGLRLAEAGVHTLIEKPLAPDAASARLVAEAFSERRLVGCVGHIERYSPALRALRARLGQGELGPVFQIATRRLGPFPARIRDVGVVMDLATHDIDFTQWLTGSQYLSVSAFAGRPSGGQHEDLVAVSGMLRDGTITSHLVNWLSPMKERVVTVTGQRGCLIADALGTELWFHRNGKVTTAAPPGHPFQGASEGDLIRYAVAKREPLATELENFRDAVLGKPADIVTMWQGVETVEVAMAVLAAARDGSAVRIPASGVGLADVPAPALASRHWAAR